MFMTIAMALVTAGTVTATPSADLTITANDIGKDFPYETPGDYNIIVNSMCDCKFEVWASSGFWEPGFQKYKDVKIYKKNSQKFDLLSSGQLTRDWVKKNVNPTDTKKGNTHLIELRGRTYGYGTIIRIKSA